jgi:hypothetical protein
MTTTASADPVTTAALIPAALRNLELKMTFKMYMVGEVVLLYCATKGTSNAARESPDDPYIATLSAEASEGLRLTVERFVASEGRVKDAESHLRDLLPEGAPLPQLNAFPAGNMVLVRALALAAIEDAARCDA